jgi:DDE superfamily endonuclease/Helix-turn-helix of DDE superfamily endonuclease
MSLNYKRISKKPVIFLRLTGVKFLEFSELCERVKPAWEALERKKQCMGRSRCLQRLEDKVLALLLYYRTYFTHEFIGYLFELHNSNVCRLFKLLEPLMAKKITIKKDSTLTQEEVLKLLVDVTEHPICRPKCSKKRKKTYSGKKKKHTQKTELVMSGEGKILSVSHTHPGRKHDFRIRKEERPLHPSAEKYVDLGYQGYQKRAANVILPFRRKRNQPLTPEQKQPNRQHASFRMKIEHKIRELKVFKILSDIYRNFGKKLHLRLNILAGIVNLKHGF